MLTGIILSLTPLATAADADPADTASTAALEEALDEREPYTDPDAVLFALQPHALPVGLQARVYLPVGDFMSVMVGAGAAMALIDPGTGETPARARVEGGVDYYFGKRFDSLFLGGRVQASYWTARPAYFGGTNVSGGAVLGQRFPLGKDGATVGVTGGVIVKAFYDWRASENTDGVTPMPMAEFDVSLPNRRKRRAR